VIQTVNTQSDERAECLVNDRLSFMCFLGLGLSDRVPDARTIWLFREKLTRAGAMQRLFDRFDAARRRIHRHVGPDCRCQPGDRAAAAEHASGEGRHQGGRVPQVWKHKPAKLRHKDRDARWTVKFTKAKPREDGSMPAVDLAIPAFVGYRNHISIDRRFGFIRKWLTTDAAAHEGRRRRDGLLDKSNTAAGVWADTAYRSATNEAFMADNGFVSRVHRNRRQLPRHRRYGVCLDLDVSWETHPGDITLFRAMTLCRSGIIVACRSTPVPGRPVGGNRSRGFS
jgi:transposase, IS5 family